MNKNLPVIKEYRLDRLTKCLECIGKFESNRVNQRNCILSHYSNDKNSDIEHREKSIFRGMVLSSLRILRLILGKADMIKLSANGKLIVISYNTNLDLYDRVISLIIFELDCDLFNLLSYIVESKKTVYKKEIYQKLKDIMVGISDTQKTERLDKWISILKQAKLILGVKKTLEIRKTTYEQILKDYSIDNLELDLFRKHFLDSYNELGRSTSGIVDIRKLREETITRLFLISNQIFTERKFDESLRSLNLEDEGYLVSFGKPMGGGEKLFEYKNKYYKTIHIMEIG